LRLAREPALLQSFRDQLSGRVGNILFDTDRFRRNIEAAYAKMRDISLAGEVPHGFAVEPPDTAPR
jgi:predicted O-linked N-acetylglucosamine transferase (SPINDLY family)